jgi:hypothetical protein
MNENSEQQDTTPRHPQTPPPAPHRGSLWWGFGLGLGFILVMGFFVVMNLFGWMKFPFSPNLFWNIVLGVPIVSSGALLLALSICAVMIVANR